jgi:hypothetical protein
MVTVQKVGKHFELAGAVERVLVIGWWPAKIDFLAHGSRGAPVVSAFVIGRTVLENGAATVGRNAPGEPLPIGKGLEALIPVELSSPSRETMRHGLTPEGRLTQETWFAAKPDRMGIKNPRQVRLARSRLSHRTL